MEVSGVLKAAVLLGGLSVALLLASAARAETTYQTATLLAVEKRVELTPASWLWDTVVTYHETVRYQLRVQMGDETYLAEYVPLIQPSGPVPTEWKPGAVLDVRVTKRSLLIKLSYGGELEAQVIGRSRAKSP